MTIEYNVDKTAITWKSERFNKESTNEPTMFCFFEDDDPRIELVKNSSGEMVWVVGYVPRHEYPCSNDDYNHDDGSLLVVSVRENCLFQVHPSTVEYDFGSFNLL